MQFVYAFYYKYMHFTSYIFMGFIFRAFLGITIHFVFEKSNLNGWDNNIEHRKQHFFCDSKAAINIYFHY